jgi:hypothetical protein
MESKDQAGAKTGESSPIAAAKQTKEGPGDESKEITRAFAKAKAEDKQRAEEEAEMEAEEAKVAEEKKKKEKEKEEKPPRPRIVPKKKWRCPNPSKTRREAKMKADIEAERTLKRKEESIREDVERLLMECEERHSWCAYELNMRNRIRMQREEEVRRLKREQKVRKMREDEDLLKETGVQYFRGRIISYKRWQNSAARHLDVVGHSGAVLSVKLSKCLTYLLSCSEDKSIRLWLLRTGKAVVVYLGHTKKVNDCDIHPGFVMDDSHPWIVSCSADRTLRIWNTMSEQSVKTLQGHSESVYRCAFSPDGGKVASCGEDQTIRTWLFPEGFLLYIYRGHLSPITSVKFSQSGRYLLSGSDYGERRLMLWDANMPRISEPVIFSHMIFWTPDGLIRKILVRQMSPTISFWLTQDQLELLGEDEKIELWPGEAEDFDVIKEMEVSPCRMRYVHKHAYYMCSCSSGQLQL